MLKEAFEKATLKPEIEYVIPYFHNNSNRFKVVGLESITDESKFRFVVDEFKDFEVEKNN